LHTANKEKNTRQSSTLGKLEKKHSAKLGTRQRNMFAECNCLALGKEICLSSVIIWHSANNFIFFSSDLETRCEKEGKEGKKKGLSTAPDLALGKNVALPSVPI